MKINSREQYFLEHFDIPNSYSNFLKARFSLFDHRFDAKGIAKNPAGKKFSKVPTINTYAYRWIAWVSVRNGFSTNLERIRENSTVEKPLHSRILLKEIPPKEPFSSIFLFSRARSGSKYLISIEEKLKRNISLCACV